MAVSNCGANCVRGCIGNTTTSVMRGLPVVDTSIQFWFRLVTHILVFMAGSLRWWRFVAICDWYKIDLSAVNVKDYFIYFKS